MKINQIVGEHKKGVRAKIYTRKPKAGPEPRKPVKPQDAEQTMEDADVTLKPLPGAQEVDINGKPVGTATTPQAATAIADLAKKGEFTPSDPNHPTSEDVSGDPTDDYVNDVTDHGWEHAQGVEEDFFGLGNKTPEEWAKTSKQMATLLQFRAKAVGTPYADQVEKRIQLLKDRLDMDKGEVAGPGGAPKDPTPPEQFDMKQLREADDALLEKMRTIAGLR
jgi:hypothetical protein